MILDRHIFERLPASRLQLRAQLCRCRDAKKRKKIRSLEQRNFQTGDGAFAAGNMVAARRFPGAVRATGSWSFSERLLLRRCVFFSFRQN